MHRFYALSSASKKRRRKNQRLGGNSYISTEQDEPILPDGLSKHAPISRKSYSEKSQHNRVMEETRPLLQTIDSLTRYSWNKSKLHLLYNQRKRATIHPPLQHTDTKQSRDHLETCIWPILRQSMKVTRNVPILNIVDRLADIHLRPQHYVCTRQAMNKLTKLVSLQLYKMTKLLLQIKWMSEKTEYAVVSLTSNSIRQNPFLCNITMLFDVPWQVPNRCTNIRQ